MNRRHFIATGSVAAAGIAVCGCDMIAGATSENADATTHTSSTSIVEPWDPIDPAFAGCAGGG